jgi:hypothetical protein
MRMTILATVLLLGLCAHGAPARADDCTPAICAGLSPTCWNAYGKMMVHKGKGIPSEAKCKEMAGDPKDFGGWIGVEGLDTQTAICACAAIYWSLDGVAQGLPDWE